uniref:GST N-terminal domain-containing protein n=1 Tax=Acrobeloides nanus TaxID=290746 RepID=A0A914CBB6_9BILA
MPKGDKFELISLHGRGRAECLRMMLIIAGHPFIDMRFNLRQWHDFKRREKLSEDTKLPLLRVNDKKLIVGASEIGRFLALNLGFYGTSSIEQAEIEEIISEIESLQSGLTPIIRTTLAKNFSQKTAYWNEYKEKTLNPVLEQLTQKLDNKNYFLGNRV